MISVCSFYVHILCLCYGSLMPSLLSLPSHQSPSAPPIFTPSTPTSLHPFLSHSLISPPPSPSTPLTGMFVSCAMDRRIVMWSVFNRRVKAVFTGHTRGVRTLSAYETTLLSGQCTLAIVPLTHPRYPLTRPLLTPTLNPPFHPFSLPLFTHALSTSLLLIHPLTFRLIRL